MPKRSSSHGRQLFEPDEGAIERAATLEVGDGEPDLDAGELLRRRTGHDHELDLLAVGIRDERRAPALAAKLANSGDGSPCCTKRSP